MSVDVPSSTETSPPPEHELILHIGLDALQRVQDRFSALGAVSACLSDMHGELITRPTWGSRYSSMIGESPVGQVTFRDCLRALARNPDIGVPSLCCLEGMTLHSTVIRSGRRELGILVIGSRPFVPSNRDAVLVAAARYQLDPDELWQAGRKVDPYRGGAPEDIYRFAGVLTDIIAALYSQSTRIERQLRDLETVHAFTELLSGTRKLEQILDITVRRVVEVMRVKAAAIRLLNPETGELVLKAVHNLSAEYLAKGPVMLTDNVIDATAFAGQTVYIEDAPSDPRIRYPENARREGIVSGLSLPLTYRGQTVGVIRVYTGRPHRFTDEEVALLKSIGAQTAAAVITHGLRNEQADAERVQRQIELAAQVQKHMMPDAPPQHPGLDIGCVYEPTLELGGDFFDLLDWPGESLAFCVADVAGKGLPAALLTASVRASLRAFASQVEDPAMVVAKVNEQLCRDAAMGNFATFVYGLITPDTDALYYTNAGHLPPLLFRAGDSVELTAGGMVIGVARGTPFEQERVPLQHGDLLVTVTDGVTEAWDFEGRAFGRDRLLASIRRHLELPAQQIARQMLWDVRRFVGLARQSDDITIVVIKVK
jgi:serine phosphatase RsbU (regulator of sigma subunit)